MAAHGRSHDADPLELALMLSRGEGGAYAVQARSDTGSATGSLDRNQLAAARGMLPHGQRTMALPAATARAAGEALFTSLFSDAIGDLYDEVRSEATRRGGSARLLLDVAPPELVELPWELLYDPRRASHLALSTTTLLIRGASIHAFPREILEVPAPLRILGVVADPSDRDRLRGDRERELVDDALAGLQGRGLVELRWLIGATWRDLQRALRLGPWHILHFVGHGEFDPFRNEGYLLLPREDGTAAPLRASDLAALLADSHSLRLALLNACEGARGSGDDSFSSIAATLVHAGVPAVVAMQDAIGDRAAIEFGRAFYEAVADGSPVDVAVGEARKGVSLAIPGGTEWATPVLYATAPGVLFRLATDDWAAPVVGTLPVPETPLVGRVNEIAAIGDLLRGPRARLVTLIGPGGIGKTRLAVECARRAASSFPDGVDFVELAPLADDALVGPEIMRVLGVADTGAPPLDLLRAALTDRRRLLVLDNCEHLKGVGPLVGALLATCPGLKVLATSRSPLRVRGEEGYHLAPLATPDLRKLPPLDRLARIEAVALFVARARAARDGFALTEVNAAAVAGICARLDGLPLALELAAARMRALPPKTVLAQLDRRFELLTDGGDPVPHKQALETTIAWSYDLLSPPEQALFRRLAVFAGGFTLEGVEGVALHGGGVGFASGGEEGEGLRNGRREAGGGRVSSLPTSDLRPLTHPSPPEAKPTPPSPPPPPVRSATPSVLGLVTLVDHSLLRLHDDPSGDGRWTMLESLRAFGNDRLEEAGEADTVRAAHAAFFRGLTREAAPHLSGPAQGEWLGRLASEHDNVRSGLDWALESGDADTAVEMASTLWRFWNARGHLYEGRRRVETVIGQFDGAPALLDARLFVAAGSLARAHGDYPAASQWIERGLARARATDDRATEATLLHNAGNVALTQGDHQRAAELFTDSLAIFRALNDTRREMVTLANLGAVAHYLGDVATAERSYRAAWELFDAAGDASRAALMLGNLALLLASLPARLGDARIYGERCLAASRALEYPAGIAVGASGLGFVAECEGNLAAAAAHFAESAQISRDIEDRGAAATAQGNLARIIAEQGDVKQGFALAVESFAEFRALGDEYAVATTIEILALIARSAGEPGLAVRLHAAATAALERLNVPLQLALRERHERDMATLRETLGAAFEDAWASGNAMTAEDVSALVAPLARGSAGMQRVSAQGVRV